MKRSGTALSFLLSEVSSGGGLVQAMEEGGPNTPPYSETHRVVWRHSYRWENQGPERSVQVWGSIQVSSLRLQPLLLGARSQQGSGRRDHSGLDGRFLIAQGGHTFGAGPMAPFWETEAGLKDSSKQDSGIELIWQELDLNPRLVTDAYVAGNLSRTFFLCEKMG